jgi:hypothetical protein
MRPGPVLGRCSRLYPSPAAPPAAPGRAGPLLAEHDRRGAQAGHRPVLRRRELHDAGRAPGSRADARDLEPLLRAGAGRGPPLRGDDQQVPGRRLHGAVRRPGRARGPRLPRRPRGAGDPRDHRRLRRRAERRAGCAVRPPARPEQRAGGGGRPRRRPREGLYGHRRRHQRRRQAPAAGGARRHLDQRSHRSVGRRARAPGGPGTCTDQGAQRTGVGLQGDRATPSSNPLRGAG